MISSNALITIAPNQNAWKVLPSQEGPEIITRASSAVSGGVTVMITSVGQIVSVSITHQGAPQNVIEVLSTNHDETGFIGMASLVPSISDCGDYFYASISDGAHIQVKKEADGIVVDVVDTDGDCVDTAAIFYSDIEPQGASEYR